MFPTKIIFFCMLFSLLEAAGPPSPCPSVFEYDYNGTHWHGLITISNVPNRHINLNVQLSIAAILPSKYSGEIKLLDPKEKIFQSIKHKGIVHYKVIFPLAFPLPVVTSISLNDNRICTGPSVTGSFVTQISLEHSLLLKIQSLSTNDEPNNYKFGTKTGQRTLAPDTRLKQLQTTTQPSPFNLFPSIDFRPAPTDEPAVSSLGLRSKFEGDCGTTVMSKPLVVSGSATKRASYPWLAAIFVQTDLGISFMCGGNLISNRHVITAAHCIKLSVEGPTQNPEDFVVMLGKYKIKKFNEAGSIISDVSKIDLYPDYHLDTADADLAVLTLKEDVEFTSFIRPICVFTEPQFLGDLVGEHGLIAGWGRDEFGNRMTSVLKETTVKVVSQEDCLRSHVAFRGITSDRTFCAGGQSEGSGPCTGDSGGGLYVTQGNKVYLRGIISRSLVEKGNSLGCDTFSYSVFVDVGRFTNWINKYLH